MDKADDRTTRFSEDLTVPRLDERVQRGLAFSREYALIQGHTIVRSVHLVVGLVSQRSPLTVDALAECELSPDRLCLALLRMIKPTSLPNRDELTTCWSSTSRTILDRAVGLAQGNAFARVEEKHLWRAILMETHGVVFQALNELGVVEAVASRLDGV